MARKPKTVQSNNFNSLEAKVSEIQKLAKRANVRIKLLEDKGVKNEAYEMASYFNETRGRDKNRFYEGKKYQSKEEIEQTYNYLKSFINDGASTLTGVKQVSKVKAQQIIKEDKNKAYQIVKKLSETEKIYIAQELSKQANKQLKQLEDNKIDYFAYAKALHYNNVTGREKNRFYRGGKFKNSTEINVHLQNVLSFLKSESSTVEGINNIHNRKIETFRKKGIKIAEGQEKEFFDFLSSAQFKALKQYADSNQILETYVDSRNAKQDAEKINSEFQKFQEGKITFDVVQERLQVAKWQNKLFK